MKVLYVSGSYIPSESANSMQVMQMSQGIVKLGHEVVLLAKRNVGLGHQVEVERFYGLSERWPTVLSERSGFGYVLEALRLARCVDPDVVYTRHLSAAATLATLGRPTTLELHDLPHSRREDLYLRMVLTSRGLVNVVAISEGLLSLIRDRYRRALKVPCSVAHDGVDWARFSSATGGEALRRALRINPALGVVGYVGSLERGRGVDLLVALAMGLPDCQFLIAGGRPSQEAEWAAHLVQEETGNVRLMGHLPGSSVPDLLAACDVLVMPYQTEVGVSGGGETSGVMSPLKMFEYMASGRPIVSSDLPVLREVLNEELAIMVPPADHGAWREAIVTLLLDRSYGESLGRRAQARARDFSWETRAATCLPNDPRAK